MTQYVLSPFYPVSDKVDESHRAGWARYWANELGATLLTTSKMHLVSTLKRGDELLCYHGMEFKGQLNLQSGLTDDILQRAKRLIDAKKRGVQFRSLDVPMPRYGRLLAERGMDPTSAEALDKLCAGAVAMACPRGPEQVIIGDSHALSLYTPRSVILRNDSLTLWGAMQRGGSWGGLLMDTNILEHEWQLELKKIKRLTFYYGNIDIRHHLARFPDTATKIKELVAAYMAQLAIIHMTYKPKEIEVVLPLPIEDESRPIPKSGWYKGAPYFGNWSRRHQIRIMLRDQLKRQCKKFGYTTYDHPKHFSYTSGELKFDVMEKPRSVHIRPSEYRLVQEGQDWRT